MSVLSLYKHGGMDGRRVGKGRGGKKKEVVRGRREGGKERKKIVATAATLVLAKTRSTFTVSSDFSFIEFKILYNYYLIKSHNNPK